MNHIGVKGLQLIKSFTLNSRLLIEDSELLPRATIPVFHGSWKLYREYPNLYWYVHANHEEFLERSRPYKELLKFFLGNPWSLRSENSQSDHVNTFEGGGCTIEGSFNNALFNDYPNIFLRIHLSKYQFLTRTPITINKN